MTKRRVLKVVLLLPLVFGAKTSNGPPSKKRQVPDNGPPSFIPATTNTTSTPSPTPVPRQIRPRLECNALPTGDLYFDYKTSKFDNENAILPSEKTDHQKSFDELKKLCKDGLHHQIPLDVAFVEENNPANYLALAIEAQDLGAIHFSKNFVELNCSTAYLQKVLIDAIFQEKTNILEALGNAFPGIFTSIFAFYEPYASYSGTYLVRIAVDRKMKQSALVMFKFVPVSVIGDFWNTVSSMKGFLLGAMKERIIRLRPHAGELGIDHRTLTDIFYICVSVGNLPALEYFIESTDFPLTTMFTDENGMSFSAMYVAVHTGNHGLVEYLGQKCPELFRIPTSTGMLPIHMAAVSGDFNLFKIFDDRARDTLTAVVEVGGVKLTPFTIAVRNQNKSRADMILAFLGEEAICNEMSKLTSWGIVDDNADLVNFAISSNEYNRNIPIDGSEFNLLEMALLGSITPETGPKKHHSSINCLELLCVDWVRHGKSFEVTHGNVRGSILGLLLPNDIPAFLALVKIGKIDPNEPIYEYSPDGTVHRTTFLNRIIEQRPADSVQNDPHKGKEATAELVRIAVKYGADPRIIDDNGKEASAVALSMRNQFVVDLLRLFY